MCFVQDIQDQGQTVSPQTATFEWNLNERIGVDIQIHQV